MTDIRKRTISGVKRVVVKVGSMVLADRERGLSEVVFRQIAADVAEIKKMGIQAVIVSSGAVAAGMKKLGIRVYPDDIPHKQAAAAVGQSSLMWLYEKYFSIYGEKVAQILLTSDDLSNRKRFLNARNTLFCLLRYGIIPIINENDSVAIDEIKFGDNDFLSALIINLAEADLLVLLSHVDGLYNKDPQKHSNAELIPLVEEITPDLKRGLDVTVGEFGTGGMVSKIEAAERVSRLGIPTIIANGTKEGILQGILKGDKVGTLIMPHSQRISMRKHWIVTAFKPKAMIVVDNGAKKAIIERGKSLLPSGISEVSGRFNQGEVVGCIGLDGEEFARGIVNYDSEEVEKIKGLNTSEIEKRLGYKFYDEVIHRDNLVIL